MSHYAGAATLFSLIKFPLLVESGRRLGCMRPTTIAAMQTLLE